MVSKARKVFALTTATMGLGLASPLASAHDVVIGGSPAHEEVIAEFPETVTLEFSGYPREGFSTIAISDTNSGEVLYTGEPTIEDQFVSLDIPSDINPGPGDYIIGFQIISSDGHSTKGKTDFTVAGADAVAQNAGSEAADGVQQEQEQSSVLTWLIGAGAVLALIGAVVAVILKNRAVRDLNSSQENSDE